MIEKSLHDIARTLARYCTEPVNIRVVVPVEAHYILHNLILPGQPYASRVILPHKDGEITIDSEGRSELEDE